MGWGYFENLSFKKHWARIGHIYMKALWYNVKSKLFTSWPPGENHIYMCLYWKKIFSRTSRPISIKLDTNHPWIKGILNCSYKGPGLQRGDYHKNTKMGWGHLKTFFSRTTKPE
jgi:hypothetical protein